jgi:LL-H family phage holin
MREQLIQMAYDVLAIVVPALVTLGIAWLYRRLGVERVAQIREQLETKRGLAEAAVLFVQQVYWELDGPAKYDQAAAWLSDMAARYGLHVTDDEVKGLIEAALKLLKAEFAEQWEK